MNLKEWRLLIIFAYFLTLIMIYLPLIDKVFVNNENYFVSMEILGFNGTTGNYFKNPYSKVNSNDTLNWKIEVNNYTPDPQLFLLRVRVENSDANPLDYISNSDSNLIVYEKHVALDSNSIIKYDFNWTVNLFNSSITSITINNQPQNVLINYYKGNYKLKFELLKYDGGDLINPNIVINGETYNIWNQINFKTN